jgi:hypothetical protein
MGNRLIAGAAKLDAALELLLGALNNLGVCQAGEYGVPVLWARVGGEGTSRGA